MRSPVAAAFRDLARALDALGVGYYVIGGQAAILYGSTRVTEDIDVTVHLGDRSAKELTVALEAAGFALRFGGPAFVERTRVLPFVQLAARIPVDVVLAGPGLEDLFLTRVTRFRRGSRRCASARRNSGMWRWARCRGEEVRCNWRSEPGSAWHDDYLTARWQRA